MVVRSDDLGPCAVEFGGNDLGECVNVTFRPSSDTVVSKNARFGTTPADLICTGNQVIVEAEMSATVLDRLAEMIPGATVVGDELQVYGGAGVSLNTLANVLILKPLINGSLPAVPTDDQKKKWIHVFRAFPKYEPDFSYNKDGERTKKFIFTGTPVTAEDNASNPEGVVPVGILYAQGFGQSGA